MKKHDRVSEKNNVTCFTMYSLMIKKAAGYAVAALLGVAALFLLDMVGLGDLPAMIQFLILILVAIVVYLLLKLLQRNQ
jgi:hypothetical protein